MAIELSFADGEIVSPGTTIYFRTSEPAINYHEQISLSKDGNEQDLERVLMLKGTDIHLSTSKLPLGLYRVKINKLLTEDQQVLNQIPIQSSFILQNICGKIEAHLVPCHIVRLAVGELSSRRLSSEEFAPDGTIYLEKVRVADRRTHVFQTLAFDSDGNLVDYEGILQDVQKRRFAKFGRLAEDLWELLDKSGDDKQLKVSIWPIILPDPVQMDLNPAEHNVASHQIAFKHSKAALISAVKAFGVNIKDTPNFPHFIATLSKAQIQELAQSKHLSEIYIQEETFQPAFDDEDDWDLQKSPLTFMDSVYALNRADLAHKLPYSGTGINVAVHEYGQILYKYKPFIKVAEEHNNLRGVDQSGKWHITAVSGLIKHTRQKGNTRQTKAYGFAPNCNLYLANTYHDDELDWAIREKKCSIVNESFTSSESSYSGQLTARDKLRDWLSTTDPYPLIIQAAGNQDPKLSTMYVHPKGYNTMSVGAHDLDGYGMTSVSCWKNPSYDGQSVHHDRELPTSCAGSPKGTSFATAVTSGTAALIQSANPDLKKRPQACRAIIYASCGRRPTIYTGTTWTEDLGVKDGHDGAGMLDAQAAVKTAQVKSGPNSHGPNYMLPGWYGSRIAPVDFEKEIGLSKFLRFRVQAPRLDSLRLRVALAWSSTVEAIGIWHNSTLSTDHALIVVDVNTGKIAGYSASFDNSYEIVDIPVDPSHEYEISLQQVSNSSKVTVFFGIAWCFFRNGLSVP